MKTRSPAVVFILSFVTCFIYHIYFLVVTKVEMNERGAEIPTAWLLLVPLVNLYWLWKWAEGVQKVTGFSAVGAFILTWLLGPVGDAVVQSSLNKVAGAPVTPPAES